MRRPRPFVPSRTIVSVLVACLFGLYPFVTGCAQSADEMRRQAEAALQRGAYETARPLYRTLIEQGDAEHALAYAETFRGTGAFDAGLRALDTLRQQNPQAPALAHARGRLLAGIGRYEDAEAAFRQALQQERDRWTAVVDLARVLDATGRMEEARDLYVATFRAYRAGTFRTAPTLRAAGEAAAALEQFRDANDAFRTAHQVDPRDVQTLYAWAELFRAKYNDADARRTYEDGLEVNPRAADLYVGLARAGSGFARQEELAREALAVNPGHVGALDVLAGLRILDGLYDEAERFVERALAVNPASTTSLAHLAAIHHLRGDARAFAAVEQRALAVNPHASDFYLTIVEDLVHRFRYPDAVDVARRAVEVDPGDWNAYATLGTALLRLGETEEARRYLEAAFEQDPYNLFAGNTLTLLDAYDDFALLESEHFRLLIHNDERDVLGPAMLDLAEACYDALAARYPYRPDGKMLIEAYDDGNDFAVRVAGVPHQGLLGVSFGDVVALNTPRARPAGTGAYNWARTLWHELAHTMAIGVSQHRVPRWLTEGLSVYEEQRARPEWGREMELAFFSALDQDRLLPLEQIDRGFTRPQFPGQVLLSYYHAAQVIGFVVDRHGFEAVTGILEALAEGHDVAAALEKVVGQDLAALDRAFREEMQRRRTRFARALDGLPDLLAEEEGDAALEEASGTDAGPFFKRLQEAQVLLEAERYDEAEARFREALAIYPNYTGEGNPYAGLAAVYRARDDRAALVEVLTQYLQLAEHGAAEARELGTLLAEAGDAAQAAYYFRRAIEVEPYDADTRTRLAALHEAQQQYADAVRERRAVLALDPVDRADAYYRLALSLYHDGQHPRAKRAVLQSLELAPGFRDAQKLLLACVEG